MPGRAPAPAAPLEVSSAADVGAVPQVSTPRTVVFQDTFDGDTVVPRPGGSRSRPAPSPRRSSRGRYRMDVAGLGDGFTAWQSAPAAGTGDTWALSSTRPAARRVRPLRHRRHHPADRDARPRRGQRDDGLVQPGRQRPQPSPSRSRPARPASCSLVGDHGVLAVLLGGAGWPRWSDPGLARRPGRHGDPRRHRQLQLRRPHADRGDLTASSRTPGPGRARRPARHRDPAPPWRLEAGVAVAVGRARGGAAGLVGRAAARDTVRDLLPVVVFLVTILVVSEVCARAGLFARRGRASSAGPPTADPDRLLLGVFLLAALVTAVLSLDATVVLLTPIVVGRGGRPRHLRPARRASPACGWPTPRRCCCRSPTSPTCWPSPTSTSTSSGSRRRMAPVLARGAGRRVRRAAAAVPARAGGRAERARARWPGRRCRVVPVVVVAADARRLRGALALGRRARLGRRRRGRSCSRCWAGVTRRLVRPRDVVRAAHPSFALLVLALGVAVAAVATGFLGDLVARLVPARHVVRRAAGPGGAGHRARPRC